MHLYIKYGHLLPPLKSKHKYDPCNYYAIADIKMKVRVKPLKSLANLGKPTDIILLEVGPGISIATITLEKMSWHF